jgi:hypothetical protein
MKIIYSLLFVLTILSCKKEIVQDLSRPRHLLTDDIYLNCDTYNPEQNDFITFTLNNKTNCIFVEKPSANSSICYIKTSRHAVENISWYEFFLCGYDEIFEKDTELFIYMSKDDFENNIENLATGTYQFHEYGTPISLNANVFKMRLIPLSKAWAGDGFRISTPEPNIFESDKAVQDNDSYMRIAEIEEFQDGTVTLKRFHLEFSCALQDHLGRKIFIRNGSAKITFPLN